MAGRTVFVGAGLTALLAAAWWWLATRSYPSSIASVPASEDTQPALPPVEMPGGARQSETAAPARAEPTRKEVAAQRGFQLRGTLWVYRADGGEDRAASGQFTAITAHGRVRAMVEQGRFTALVSGVVSEMSVTDVILDGREALLVEPRYRVPASGWVDVRARWPAAVTVHVIDAGSRAELPDVVISERQTHDEAAAVDERLVLARGASPLVLKACARSNVDHVSSLRIRAHAPGFVTAPLSVAWSKGGEYTVALERGSILDVHLRGQEAFPERGIEIAVRKWQEISEDAFVQGYAEIQKFLEHQDEDTPTTGAQEAGERPLILDQIRQMFRERKDTWLGEVVQRVPALPSGITTIDGVPPGSYLVTAELAIGGPDVVLARERADVSAGERASITLTLGAPPQQVCGVPFSGTLSVPSGWVVGSAPSLSFKLLERARSITSSDDGDKAVSLKPMTGLPGMYAWDAGVLTPGRYACSVDFGNASFERQVEVGMDGERGVALRLPRAAGMQVRLVDDSSGEPIAIEQLRWEFESGDGWSGQDPFAREGRVAPVGAVRFDVWSAHHRRTHATVSLVPGMNDVELRARRATGVEIAFADGGHAIDLPPSISSELRLECVDGTGTIRESRTDGHTIILYVDRPGDYRLTLCELPGYRPVPGVVLTLSEGVIVRHEVVLHSQ